MNEYILTIFGKRVVRKDIPFALEMPKDLRRDDHAEHGKPPPRLSKKEAENRKILD